MVQVQEWVCVSESVSEKTDIIELKYVQKIYASRKKLIDLQDKIFSSEQLVRIRPQTSEIENGVVTKLKDLSITNTDNWILINNKSNVSFVKKKKIYLHSKKRVQGNIYPLVPPFTLFLFP